jgi:DNA-binding ferritin-like protein
MINVVLIDCIFLFLYIFIDKTYKNMEITQIADIIFKLYLYADATKMIHYTTESNHAHELCDTVRDTINDFADELAEQSFGYYGKPSYTQLTKLNNLEINETDDLGELCGRASEIVDILRTEFSKNDKLSGIVSLIDDYKGSMQKNMFLCSFDKVSNYKGEK